MKNSTELDSQELLHLAIEASDKQQRAHAIEYLKRAKELDPNNAEIHHMLGAEHAQIGLFDRAIEDMSHALQLNPELDTARFQLGLLYLTSKRPTEANEIWQPLDQLDHEHSFYLLKTGLMHLARDEFKQCLSFLRRGIAANSFNAPLNKDMQRIIDDVLKVHPDDATPDASSTAGTNTPQHHLISAYTDKKR
jgi:tetratricopeptide (TPR) repeat protein